MAAECPICGKPAAAPFRPFCSKRCADIDLHSWLKGGYAIPGPPAAPGQGVTPGSPTQIDPEED